MRSRSTNVLQVMVLVTGLIYIIIGIFFYLSPISVVSLFSSSLKHNTASVKTVNSYTKKQMTVKGGDFDKEEWLKQVVNDEIISPLYFSVRVFAALLFVAGLSMIMPLFDPLRYRGLIYYNGLIFPLLASLIAVISLRTHVAMNRQIAEKSGIKIREMSIYDSHNLIIILGIVFLVLFIMNAVGLLITKKLAVEGKE